MPKRIIYTLSMPNPNKHYFEVTIDIQDAARLAKNGTIRIAMPVWTPGSYLVREFARNVLEISAIDPASQASLICEKQSKNSWLIQAAPHIRISYKVYAFEYTVDTSYLDTRHAVVNGASVFMYVEGAAGEELLLKVVPFPEWTTISTGLELIGSGTSEFMSPNYDILIDSPIEIGNQTMHSFDVKGIRHEVSIFGPNFIDILTFVSDLKRIVESTWPVFGEIPYHRYLFLVDFAGSAQGGGLEHRNSTHCIAQRLRTAQGPEYKQFLSLFSHEFFHTWNVKRLRPIGLGPFDYDKETYTKSLWIAEGITSYYDDLIIRRAGISSAAEYLDAFCININYMMSFPSYRFQSAEESSFDTWIKYYRPNENTPNSQASYYVQGALIGWMIDMEIRNSTSSRKSLDHVMQKMYLETFVKDNRGYTEEEFERLCNSVAGKNLSSEIFDSRVRGREKIDYEHFLSYAGLKLGNMSNNILSKGYLGVKLRSEGGRTIVVQKLFGSPAETCGLAAGDEIVAFDNLRMDASLIPYYLSNKKPGDRLDILVSRDGYLETRNAMLDSKPVFEHRIYKGDDVGEEQKSFFKSWLGCDWNLPLEYSEYLSSPLKPRPLDFV